MEKLELFLNWYCEEAFWPIVVIGFILSIAIFCVGVYREWDIFSDIEGIMAYVVAAFVAPFTLSCIFLLIFPPTIVFGGLYCIINLIKKSKQNDLNGRDSL